MLLVTAPAAGCSDQPPPDAAPPSVLASPVPSTTPIQPSPRLDLGKVDWLSWAVIDRSTGGLSLVGGETGTSTTESMIKTAIGAQYLRDLEDAGKTPTAAELDSIMSMIRDSDNDAAESLYRAGGRDAMLRKVKASCRLTGTTTRPNWWSETQMSSVDAARLGQCIASGRVCSQEWTTWLLGQMRQVRGEGRFGIVEAFPEVDGQPLAFKNGWQIRSDGWHVNCLAVTPYWSLAIMMRYPERLGLRYGAAVCALVAAATPVPGPAPVGTPA